MRIKITFLMLALTASAMSFAQMSASDFSIGVAGNYTMYKGDFQKSTPGIKLELGYGLQSKVGFTLGFTKGFAIKTPSEINSSNGLGDSKTTSSEIQTNFSTVSLNVNYRFIGDDETPLSVYAPVGVGFVMAKFKETPNEAIPAGYTAMDQLEPGKESGFTINGGLGVMYKIGVPMIFAEANVALPANKTGNTYVENYIPAHFYFNVGVRIGFGGSNE